MRPFHLRALAVALAGLIAVPAFADPPGSTVLTLEQSIRLALEHNARLGSQNRTAEAEAADAKATRGRLLPQVSISANYYNASSPESVDVGKLLGSSGASSSGATSAAPESVSLHTYGLGLGIATASQPLLGLWHLSHEFSSASDRADASRADVREERADLRQKVENHLLSLFEARALAGIAEASLAELREEKAVTEAKIEHGVATRGDLLRVQVGLANATEQFIEAQVQEKSARAALLTLLGLPLHSSAVEFVEPTEVPERAIPTEAEQAEVFALEHRPAVAARELERSAAHHAFIASQLKLLPELDATAMYVRVQGLPAGLPPDYFTVGFSFSWAIWDSGATYYKSRAAAARAEAAAELALDTRQQVALEVDERLEEESAAAAAVAVAEEAVRQAEEAYRVTAASLKAGAATTTDLLEAQSALTQARLNLVRSRFGKLRARSDLIRAMGLET